jgi:hypothetical protein
MTRLRFRAMIECAVLGTSGCARPEPGWRYRVERHTACMDTACMDTGEPDVESLAAAWWQYQRLAAGTRVERKRLEQGRPARACRAAESVRARIDAGGLPALHLVVALLKDADPDDAARVAAGPLEDLVHQHATTLSEDLDRLARRDRRFRDALRSVWLNPDKLPPGTADRLARWVTTTR